MTNPDWDHPPVTLGRLLPLLGLGLLGVGAHLHALRAHAPALAAEAGTEPGTLLLAAAVLWLLTLTAAVAAGLHAAPRTGFTSRIQDRINYGTEVGPGLRADLGPALLAALAAGGIHHAAARRAPEAAALPARLGRDELLATLPVHVLYGALAEELVLRWGLVPLLALGLTVLVHRRRTDPSTPVIVLAVVLAAIASGPAGAPAALALGGTPAPALSPWVLATRAAVGLVLGLLFWRQSLEAAMMAHGLLPLALVATAAGLPPG